MTLHVRKCVPGSRPEPIAPQPAFRAFGSALEWAQGWTRRTGIPTAVYARESRLADVSGVGLVTLAPSVNALIGPVRVRSTKLKLTRTRMS